jgi:hypothetical protein
MLTGLGLLILLLPYPRFTIFGNTNFAFELLLLVIWLLRITLRQSPGPHRTPLDVPIAGLLITFIVSFYNVTEPSAVPLAMKTMVVVVSGILLFYMVVSNTRTERDLRRIHDFQAVSLMAIFLFGLFELTHPGGVLIPGWISFRATAGAEITKNLRIGGPFRDFELFSEFCAVYMLLIVFLFVRAQTLLRRLFYGGLLVLDLFMLFATVTRGAMISLFAGVLYLVFLMRRRLQFVPFVIITVMVIAGFMAMNYYVSRFTISGDLFARMQGTTFHGLVPDDRVNTWAEGWERFLMHPIIGSGPVYLARTGTREWMWPHNGYLLVANMVGAVGLSFFVWILVRLWISTHPKVDSLFDASYARSYMLIAHVQLAVFIVDQLKIDFLRNLNYAIQVWLLFAVFAAGAQVARAAEERLPRAAG